MMLEGKDPAIRLFGRMIQLAQDDDVSGHPRSADSVAAMVVVVDCEHSSEISSSGSVSPRSVSDKSPADGGGSVDLKLDHGSSSSVLDQTKSSSEDKESSSPKVFDKEEEEEEEGGTSGSQDNNNKPLKKPTKILPCPRCNSTETKFCYFNNYNVNQPRHFCKKCQRYWTAGGTMRSMVIGAGRRKNKNSNSCLNPHPFVIPNALPDSSIESQKTDNVSFQSFATLWPNPAFAVPIYAVPPFWYSPAALRPDSQLGKHPRDGNQLEISNEEEKRAEITKVLVPKTLRFDDPSEAAKSSIWTTLGIKNEKIRSLDSGAFFGGFESKGGEMYSTRLSTSRLLQANPAALSRSVTFHECT